MLVVTLLLDEAVELNFDCFIVSVSIEFVISFASE